MTTNPPKNAFTARLQKSLAVTRDAGRWEQLIMSLLQRLELDKVDRAKAIKQYDALADDIATKLDIPRHNVDVYSQGSMRTQTTIRPRGNAKFDIDIMVELSGPKYNNPDSEAMFDEFGKALEGNEEITGGPEPRRRCWRLQYPGEAFYFDVTPAVADMYKTFCSTGWLALAGKRSPLANGASPGNKTALSANAPEAKADYRRVVKRLNRFNLIHIKVDVTLHPETKNH